MARRTLDVNPILLCTHGILSCQKKSPKVSEREESAMEAQTSLIKITDYTKMVNGHHMHLLGEYFYWPALRISVSFQKQKGETFVLRNDYVTVDF